MCGFTGFISFSQHLCAELETTINNMNNSLYHRGPDSDGVWVDANVGLALGHRRLAIQDLSPSGHQPMDARSGRYVMVFNGEVYNHLELRKELGSIEWHGHSDTETILACIDRWGFVDTLKKLTGMFAIVLWDKKEQKIHLARDRMGEKPLYYAIHNNVLIFGSELKALKQHPSFNADIDRDSLCLYMRHNCIPAPYSIYKNTFKLMPASYLTIYCNWQMKTDTYWSATDVVNKNSEQAFTGSPEEAVKTLTDKLSKAVKQQAISDVPLGAFLSGGIDSTSIVALMQNQTQGQVKTFTMGFDSKAYNEAEHAKVVAKHLGTDHTEMYVTPKDAMDVIPSLHEIYDEPFADSSQIPTFLVSKLTKSKVTVALSGDGGDELFAGYNRHKLAHTMWPKVTKLPGFARNIAAKGIKAFSPSQLDMLNHALPPSYKMRLLGDKFHKAANVIGAHDEAGLYLNLVSQWKKPENVVLGSKEPSTIITSNQLSDSLNTSHRMMALDMMTYMPDDILTKVDRASMAVSLETRVPMLDHNVVEFAWSLPLAIKLKDGVGKWPLRQMLYQYVPKKLIERPKMGFGIPLDEWLRGPLREWAEELLHPERLNKEGYFNQKLVTEAWCSHLSGKATYTQELWCVLMFQQWLSEV
ncbi:asparagine synthase (glutamine-hydrolyzing) [Vibrio sp. 10N.222.54.A3]|uniref:asparagine synthase (glutamine-hydrolyzing) n=1 Tax=Vibrio sp. 10N.222.54.A3 TaxID=3229633 RepID=UPI003550EDA2